TDSRHSACKACLHEDGGGGALYEETDEGRVALGGGVSIGPGFRVLSCDCPKRHRAAPSGWCGFCRCRCKTCGGGKEAARAWAKEAAGWGEDHRGGHSDPEFLREASPGAGFGAVFAAALLLGLWFAGMRIISTPCYCLPVLGAVSLGLCLLKQELSHSELGW
ncbi:unnamed protein product, partial [Discosporangium mesarthrocarpum]